MRKYVDARKMECPLPVIHTKKALEENDVDAVTTIVDNEVAVQNIMRLANNLGFEFFSEKKENDYYIDVVKSKEKLLEKSISTKLDNTDLEEKNNDNLVIIITSQTFGEGEEELGKILIKGYIFALTEVNKKPKTIIFLNEGVKLVTEGSQVIENLKILEEKNVEIISCGTCLDYYGLKDKLLVGSIGNMYSIVEILNNASNTIKI